MTLKPASLIVKIKGGVSIFITEKGKVLYWKVLQLQMDITILKAVEYTLEEVVAQE